MFFFKKSAAMLFMLSLFIFGRAGISAADDIGARLKVLAGTPHVKVVFARTSIAYEDDFPTTDFYTDEVLVGFDSDVDKEDTLQTAKMNYQNPLITHDGGRVVYTRIRGTKTGIDTAYSYIVDWSKNATPRKVATGMTACLWFDPATDKEYAIYAKNNGLSGGGIYKIDLDDSLSDTLVLAGQHPVTQWLRISTDGKAFAGCMGEYGTGVAPMKVVDRSGNALVVNTGGCWPSMPYDNSRRLVKTTADHNKWEVKGPDDDTGSQPVYPVGMFSQMRMASYSTNIFLIVVNSISGDNGTGDIKIVKTDSTLLTVSDTLTMAPAVSAGNCHHADLWAGSAVSVVPHPNLRPASGDRSAGHKNLAGCELYTITGRKIVSSARPTANSALGLPAGLYVSVRKDRTAFVVGVK